MVDTKKAAKNILNFNNECVKELKILWKNKLETTSDEKQQMDAQIQILRTKIEADKNQRDKEQELFKKFVEES